ncbi:MAG: glycosyltransferase [Fibrobacter sp.]|nr:glycosyltransferase [Fibrobacter sp.]
MKQPLVSILCATYNQEKYIAQTIEGFLIQKVDFPIEIIIHDDASTDGTADIVRKYEAEHPDLIKGIYQTENQYSKKVPIWNTFIYPKATGKYFAECEGDDYWTDPSKLQRQVDFLESHPDYILSHTAFKYYDQNNGVFLEDQSIKRNLEIQEKELEKLSLNILDRNQYRIQTVTTLYRRELWSLITDSFAMSKYFLMGDTQLFFFASTLGKIHYDPTVTSVYRLTPNSACHRGEKNKAQYRFNLSCEEMRVYLSKYIQDEPTIQKFKTDFGRALIRYAVFDPSFRSKIDESVISSKRKFVLFCARHSFVARKLIKMKWKL